MNDIIKAAAVLAIGALICTSVWIYFSPFQTCIRTVERDQTSGEPVPLNYVIGCARAAGGGS